MDDLKQPTEAGNLRLHGCDCPANDEPPLPRGFVPLRLVLHPGGCSVALTRPDMVVGRHSSMDMRLHLPDVSRRHCRFVFAEGNWQIFDLDSLNGVFVNDQAVDQAILHQGDRIRIGSYTFEVDLNDQADADPQRPNGLKTLGNIADVLPRPPEHSQRQAS
jgi:predicted component of type VI protein secretion system